MHQRGFSKITAIAIVAILLIGGVAAFVWYQKQSKPPVEIPKPAVIDTAPKVAKIGTSVEGRSIDSYTFTKGATAPAAVPASPVAQSSVPTPKHLTIVGGIHGGYEWNSVILAYQFIDYFTAHPEAIPANTTITIIPSANPDGVYKIIGKTGRFGISDIPAGGASASAGSATGVGRFNAHDVDLNRNFDCKWKPESTWRTKKVSAGTSAFSEPEAQAIRDFARSTQDVGFSTGLNTFIFLHSQSNAVYASECTNGILPVTRDIMNAYSKASGYKAVDVFDSYEVTGDAEGWLASIGIPAITVELSTHQAVEWEKNLSGVKSVLEYYSKQ